MHDKFIKLAIAEARKSMGQGGIPIGSVLVKDGEVVAAGHNKRVQERNPILHGEMDCLHNAGRIGNYRKTILYSTLMPCYMCAGTVVQFKIPTVVVGEAHNFEGAKAFMESHGVEVINLHSDECINMLGGFIQEQPTLWHEDIGEL